MKLIANWKELAPKLTSVQLSALSAVLSAIEVALPYFAPKQPNGWFAAASALAAIAAGWARLVRQPELIK